MAATGTIKIKFKRRKTLEALHAVYLNIAPLLNLELKDPHERLLLEHGWELLQKIAAILAKGKEHNTLELSGTEALAFTQFWARGAAAGPLGAVAVSAVVAAIDQYRKSPTRLITEIL